MKKEFKLKEEREGRLRDYLRNLGLHNLEIDNVLRVIEVQDKEFIKRLKDELPEYVRNLETRGWDKISKIIDELSGLWNV